MTVTEGSSVYERGLCLKDTFDDKQDFVTGSFRVTAPGGTPQSPATGFNCTENVISYEFIPTNTRDNVWTFQYSTSVKDTAIIEEGMLKTDVSVVLENDAKLLNQEDNSIISEDTDTVTKDFHYNWLTKTSSVEGCSPGEVKWTLTVDSNGYPFDNITVYDKVTGTPVDSTPKCQILYDDSSISYTNTVSTPVVEYASAECIATSTIQQNGQSYAMKIDLGAIPAGTGAITITYKTKVTNYGEYIRHNQPQVNNSAWLTYQWPDYNGTGESIQLGIPTLKVPSPIVSSMITKSDGVYDKSTHEITWKVEVNRNKSNLDNLSVKDIIGEGQEFVRFQNLMIDYVDTDLTSYPVDETETGKKTLHFGSDLDGKTAVFEVVTKLTDQDYFENNVTETGASGTIPVQTFVNKVKLYQGADCISSDDGTVKPINTVFTKKTPDYNYATKTLSWKLEVNQDKMALSEPVITDVIPTGLILDQEHIYLRSSSGEIRLKSEMEAAGVKPYYTYDETSHRLSVCLNDFAEGDAAQTICFDTKIDVEHAEFEGRKFTEYSGDITISNTAELHKSGSSTVASTGKIIIDNQLLKKSGTKDTGTSGQGDYRVVMNQPGIMLPAHTQVIDILSPGMRLNLPSLKLYEAAVNPDGTVNAIGAELTNYTYTTEILASGNAEGKAAGSTKLVLQLPENPGNKIYLMSYQAIVTDTTFSTYKNEISMTGVAENSQGTDVVMSANMLFGSGGGSVSASSMVEVTKYNADGTTALPGAVFALIYQDNGGNEHIIDTGTTGVDGKLTFRSLEVGTRYTVKEIEAPAGYELGTEVAKDFVAPEKGYTKREQLTFYNESKKATLQFKVKNSTGSPILGARFSLWRVVPDPTDPETNLETKIDEIESDNEGIVCFRLVPTGAYLIKEEAMTSGYLSSNLPIYANVDSLGSLTELYRVEEDGTRVDLTVESVIPEASPSVPGGDSGTTPPGTDGGDSGTTPPGTEGGDGGTTPPGTDGGDGGITPPGTDGGDVGITPPGTEGGDGGTTPPDTGSGDSEITPPDTGSGDSGITPTGIANINSVTTLKLRT